VPVLVPVAVPVVVPVALPVVVPVALPVGVLVVSSLLHAAAASTATQPIMPNTFQVIRFIGISAEGKTRVARRVCSRRRRPGLAPRARTVKLWA
jgi:hypothetical protein